jgi:hypothetical protein
MESLPAYDHRARRHIREIYIEWEVITHAKTVLNGVKLPCG